MIGLFYDVFIEWLTTVKYFWHFVILHVSCKVCLIQHHTWLQIYEIYSWLIVQIIILIIITIAQPYTYTCFYITDERASTRKSNLICVFMWCSLLITYWYLEHYTTLWSLSLFIDEWCVMLCTVSHEMELVGITIDIKPPRNRK